MIKPTIIYIAGYGFSGSTLLERSLADNIGVIGCGELWRLKEDFQDFETCGCDQNVETCEFWAELYEIFKANPKINNLELMDILVNLKSQAFLIDNSKTSYARVDRFKYLASKYNFKVIHLIREPGSVLNSSLNKSNSNNFFVKFLITLKVIVHWNYANRIIYKLQKQYNFELLRIRLEDFLERPQNEIEKVYTWLNYKPDSINSKPIKTHQLTGNIYRHGELELQKSSPRRSNFYSKIMRIFSFRAIAQYNYKD